MNATETKKLKELCSKVSVSVKWGAALAWEDQGEWQRNADGYRVTLRYHGRQYTFDFWQGIAVQGEPTAEGCLDCLLSDSTATDQTFEDFCSDVGCDTDSRKAERLYRACVKVGEHVKRLLGDEYETFLYSERN